MELLAARTRVRTMRPGDADALSAYRSQPEVARFQSWNSLSPADAARLIEKHAHTTPDTPDAWLQLGVTLAAAADDDAGIADAADSGRAADALIGDVGVHFLADTRLVELGVTLDPAYQGRGLAAEAVTSVLRHLFDTLGKHRVTAFADAENGPSIRLFRRLGFREEGHFVDHLWFKGAWCSERQFAMLRREWLARPS